MTLASVLQSARENCGFLSEEDVKVLAEVQPHRQLLIRFNASRCLAPAILVLETIAQKEAAGDFVRDVSIPASDPLWRT